MGVGPFYVGGWVIGKIYAFIKKICKKGLDRLGLGGLLCPGKEEKSKNNSKERR